MEYRADIMEREHPRVCGENIMGPVGAVSAGGTSPRMRGKPGGGEPASGSVEEHPRVCGENEPKKICIC